MRVRRWVQAVGVFCLFLEAVLTGARSTSAIDQLELS